MDERAPRLLSLDVMRGLTVALMILVNNPGDGDVSFHQLHHALWNGCTLTDLVFPAFLFLMGCSLPQGSRFHSVRGGVTRAAVRKVLRRSIVLVLLGLLLNALPRSDWHTLRFCGVLQRIGFCYCVAALTLFVSGRRGVFIVTVLCIVGYWLLLVYVPVPGYGLPGKAVPLLDPQGNLASWLDRLVIPREHLYRASFYDPEGLLSTLAAIGTTGCGVLTGLWMRRTDVRLETRRRWMICAALALIACGLLWSHWLPFNKRLWTSSYAIFSAGVALLCVAAAVWLTDERERVPRPILQPWIAFGRNALVGYLLSELLAIALGAIRCNGNTLQRQSFEIIPVWIGTAPMRSLAWSLVFLVVCFLPIAWLHRRGVTIKL